MKGSDRQAMEITSSKDIVLKNAKDREGGIMRGGFGVVKQTGNVPYSRRR